MSPTKKATTTLPPPQSALSQLISSTSTSTSSAPPPPPNDPSLSSTPHFNSDALALPLQILHNLQHQHSWTNLRLHPLSPNPHSNPAAPSSSLPTPPPVTLLSGLPPKPLYIHPDRQSQLLSLSQHRKKSNLSALDLIAPEPEYILPLAIGEDGEKYTLRRFARIFDALPEREPWSEAEAEAEAQPEPEPEQQGQGQGHSNRNPTDGGGGRDKEERGRGRGRGRKRRDAKRILLAMQTPNRGGGGGGDGTVVYYVMMEGDVKPRQN